MTLRFISIIEQETVAAYKKVCLFGCTDSKMGRYGITTSFGRSLSSMFNEKLTVDMMMKQLEDESALKSVHSLRITEV